VDPSFVFAESLIQSPIIVILTYTMVPALSFPSGWEGLEAFSSSMPIVTTTPVPGVSFGSSGATASDIVTNDRPDSTKHSLQSIKDTSAVAPSHIIIDPTPVASDLHVTLVLAPTVELADILELLEEQGVNPDCRRRDIHK
jgi:hypothetical protein